MRGKGPKTESLPLVLSGVVCRERRHPSDRDVGGGRTNRHPFHGADQETGQELIVLQSTRDEDPVSVPTGMGSSVPFPGPCYGGRRS